MAGDQAPGTRPRGGGGGTTGQDGPASEDSRDPARGTGSAGANGCPLRSHHPPSSRLPSFVLLELGSPMSPTGTQTLAGASTEQVRERQPPGAMTPAPRGAAAGPGQTAPVSPGYAYLSGRRSKALHRGNVPLHLGLAAPHRAADLASRAREASVEANSSRSLPEPRA